MNNLSAYDYIKQMAPGQKIRLLKNDKIYVKLRNQQYMLCLPELTLFHIAEILTSYHQDWKLQFVGHDIRYEI